MLCYTIFFSGIATPAHVPDRVFGEWHILFNDAQSLMGRYYARGLISVRAGDFQDCWLSVRRTLKADFELCVGA